MRTVKWELRSGGPMPGYFLIRVFPCKAKTLAHNDHKKPSPKDWSCIMLVPMPRRCSTYATSWVSLGPRELRTCFRTGGRSASFTKPDLTTYFHSDRFKVRSSCTGEMAVACFGCSWPNVNSRTLLHNTI